MKPALPVRHPSTLWLVLAGVFLVNASIAAFYGQRLLAALAAVTGLSSLWAAARPPLGDDDPPRYP